MSLTEIRIHGRGGQGNVVAANLLAMAAFEIDRFGQAFPNFGAERRGAPVMAFVRISDHPVRRRCQVLHPRFLIIQDEALWYVPQVLDGIQPGGAILLNSTRSASDYDAPEGVELVTLPASSLAREYLGRPVPNTALLAGFLALTELLPTDALIGVLGRKFKGDVLEKNTRLIREASGRVPAGQWKELQHAASA